MSYMSVNSSITSAFNQVFSNGNKGKCAIIEQNTCDLPMTEIKETPSFFVTAPTEVDYGISLDELGSVFKRMSERTQERVLKKANTYKIPFSLHSIDLFALQSKVGDYELLLEEADRADIDWDISTYDPVVLQQALDDHGEQESYNRMEDHHGFYSFANLGV